MACEYVSSVPTGRHAVSAIRRVVLVRGDGLE